MGGRTLNAYLKAQAKEAIEVSAWFQSAPAEVQRTAVIKMAGTAWSQTTDGHPLLAVYADCTAGEETRRFRALVTLVSDFQLHDRL